jgi:hypothetical protein
MKILGKLGGTYRIVLAFDSSTQTRLELIFYIGVENSYGLYFEVSKKDSSWGKESFDGLTAAIGFYDKVNI